MDTHHLCINKWNLNQQKRGFPGDRMVVVSKPSSQDITSHFWCLVIVIFRRSRFNTLPLWKSCEELWFTECCPNPFHDRIQKINFPAVLFLGGGKLLMNTFPSKEDSIIKVSIKLTEISETNQTMATMSVVSRLQGQSGTGLSQCLVN